MAMLADRLIYRLSAVWWTAVYAGLRGANPGRVCSAGPTAARDGSPAGKRVLTAA